MAVVLRYFNNIYYKILNDYDGEELKENLRMKVKKEE